MPAPEQFKMSFPILLLMHTLSVLHHVQPTVRCNGLQPLRVPGFAFAWLDLMSHRNLMPKLLLAPSHKGWPNFQRLLLALLRFLEPYLRNAELTDAVRLLYKVSNCSHSFALWHAARSCFLAVAAKCLLNVQPSEDPGEGQSQVACAFIATNSAALAASVGA